MKSEEKEILESEEISKSEEKENAEESAENANFEIEKIIAEKVVDGKRVYRVRYKKQSSK